MQAQAEGRVQDAAAEAARSSLQYHHEVSWPLRVSLFKRQLFEDVAAPSL